MNPILLYLLGASASLLLSWILVHLLRASLAELLEELWASRARAAFWAAVGCVSILLLGIFAGTGTGSYADVRQLDLEDGFFAVAGQLRWTLGGLFAALLMVALCVTRFMLSADRTAREQAQHTERDS